MKLLVTSLFGLCLFFHGLSQNQMSKSIAVANPNVNNLSIKPEVAAKMMRLELIKIDKFKVLDEFDMADAIKANAAFSSGCYGLNCLSDLGEGIKVDFVLCGSFDGLGNKIAITLKMVDVKNRTIHQSLVKEFDNQEPEIQRMIEQMIKEMNQIEVDKVTAERLAFKNEPISSNNVGKINNSGPRIGYSFMLGSLNEFAKRSEEQGGLDMFPGVSMIGYQVEGQYVGTENFSALVECILNVSGLEQGKFIPSMTFMNGFRFGKAGWEFAFGPGFSVKSTSQGFFDTENKISQGSYFSQTDWNQYCLANFFNNPAYPEYNVNGVYTQPSPEEFNPNYQFTKQFDTRGSKSINTSFVFAFGRTFRRGALNVPVNVFYSSQKGGGYVGLNIGFNVQKSKTNINSGR